MKKLILILLLATLFSCGVKYQQPKILITHVLAVTEHGDTLRLPISAIKPNVYNIINYSNGYSTYPYYNSYNNYNNFPRYKPSGNVYVKPNNNTPATIPTKPAIKPRVTPSNPVSASGNAGVNKRGGN
jgi:hypothetical protein|tara:strand:+ start:903 stop:1286 length:384 start_codon:yes stop_codon:yes gene_type:complete